MSEEKDALFIKNAKAVLNKLGIKAADLEKPEINVADIVESTAVGIVENRKGDIELDAKKAAQTAAYAKLEKQLVSAFGLDASKYAALTKGQLDAIISDAKELVQPTQKDAASEPTDVASLKKQLGELGELNKNANKELAELKALKDSLPTLLDKERKGVIVGYEKQNAIKQALAQVREKGVNPLFSDAMLMSEIFSNGIDLEATEDASGAVKFRVSQKVTKADGTTEYKPIKKSESEVYQSLTDYTLDKVVKQEWLVKSNAQTIQPITNGNGATGAGERDLSKLPASLIKSLGIS